MAYILQVHHAQGSLSLHRFIRLQQRLSAGNAAAQARARAQIAEQRMLTRDARTEVVALGTAAAAAWVSLAMLKRGVETVTAAAAKFQYEGRALGAILGQQGQAGAQLYAQFERLNPQIREFAPNDVIGRMKMLAQAGYGSNEILGNMSAILDSVTASFGELNLDAAIELGINLDRAFGDAGHSMRDLLDIAAKATIQFPMTLGQITSAMGFATEAAVIYGQSLENTLLMLGLLMPVTKTATKAGTAYRRALDSLTQPATIEFLKEQGIAVKDAAGEFRAMPDILIDVARALDKVQATSPGDLQMKREEMLQRMFGTRGKAWYAALQRATELPMATGTFAGRRFADYETALMAQRIGIAASGGALSHLAEAVRNTSLVIDQKFTASLQRAGIAIGTLLLPAVDDFKRMTTSVLDTIAKAIGAEAGKGHFLAPGFGMAFSLTALVGSIMGIILTAGVTRRFLGREQLPSLRRPAMIPASGPYGIDYQPRRMPISRFHVPEGTSGMMVFAQAAGAFVEVVSVAILLRDTFLRFTEDLDGMRERVDAMFRERATKVGEAIKFLEKATMEGVDMIDALKVVEGGYGDIVASMGALLQAGATPMQAATAAYAAEKRRIEAVYAGEENKERREAELRNLEKEKAQMVERVLQWHVKTLQGQAAGGQPLGLEDLARTLYVGAATAEGSVAMMRPEIQGIPKETADWGHLIRTAREEALHAAISPSVGYMDFAAATLKADVVESTARFVAAFRSGLDYDEILRASRGGAQPDEFFVPGAKLPTSLQGLTMGGTAEGTVSAFRVDVALAETRARANREALDRNTMANEEVAKKLGLLLEKGQTISTPLIGPPTEVD